MRYDARMRTPALVVATLALAGAATLGGQPRLTLDYPAMAKRLVRQLALKPGEKVISIAHPGADRKSVV